MSTPSATTACGLRLEAFRQLGRMRAGSLIITCFGDLLLPRGGRIWLGSLIALLQPLGLSERLVRTAVYRLVKDEWLATEASGRRSDYFLTQTGRQRFEEAAEQIYAPAAPDWDGHWRWVQVVGEMGSGPREAVRRALYWQGFGELGRGSFVHPGADWEQVRLALRSDGLGPWLPALLPLQATHARMQGSADDAALVQRAWPLAALAAGYLDFVQRYQPILAECQWAQSGGGTDATALQLRLLLLHDYRRLLLRDPQLPAALLPPDWPGQQARSLCQALYLHLLPASERHLDTHLQLADGTLPTASVRLQQRFAAARAPL
ncbi:MAG: phenylacetic acid degradation operon negative regulatory protein PaaX [Serpentinimonas sp.]|nr:phenylacetic acid degradation operon negative regulatory protein PaaX [Serpentinimonas sp.]